MSALPRVAIAGATGNVGPAILKALLDAGFPVTVLTRQSSSSKVPEHPNQTIKAVDYTSHASLVDALADVKIVITTVSITGLESQKTLIDAALAAGVSRFLPSEFGADCDLPANAKSPVFKGKVETHKYLEEVAAANPGFSYTYLVTGTFFDWGIDVGIIVNAKEHTATLYNGGDIPYSTTRLSTIGEAVVGVIKHLDETKNETVVIHDGVITQNKIIDAVKKYDGKEWTTENKSTKELEQWAYEQLSKPDGDKTGATLNFILACIFSEGDECGNNHTGRTWNKRLGLKELSDEEMYQVVVDTVKAK